MIPQVSNGRFLLLAILLLVSALSGSHGLWISQRYDYPTESAITVAQFGLERGGVYQFDVAYRQLLAAPAGLFNASFVRFFLHSSSVPTSVARNLPSEGLCMVPQPRNTRFCGDLALCFFFLSPVPLLVVFAAQSLLICSLTRLCVVIFGWADVVLSLLAVSRRVFCLPGLLFLCGVARAPMEAMYQLRLMQEVWMCWCAKKRRTRRVSRRRRWS